MANRGDTKPAEHRQESHKLATRKDAFKEAREAGGLPLRMFLMSNRCASTTIKKTSLDKRLQVIEICCLCKIFPVVTPDSHSHTWQLYAIIFYDAKAMAACFNMLRDLEKRVGQCTNMQIVPLDETDKIFREFADAVDTSPPNSEDNQDKIVSCQKNFSVHSTTLDSTLASPSQAFSRQKNFSIHTTTMVSLLPSPSPDDKQPEKKVADRSDFLSTSPTAPQYNLDESSPSILTDSDNKEKIQPARNPSYIEKLKAVTNGVNINEMTKTKEFLNNRESRSPTRKHIKISMSNLQKEIDEEIKKSRRQYLRSLTEKQQMHLQNNEIKKYGYSSGRVNSSTQVTTRPSNRVGAGLKNATTTGKPTKIHDQLMKKRCFPIGDIWIYGSRNKNKMAPWVATKKRSIELITKSTKDKTTKKERASAPKSKKSTTLSNRKNVDSKLKLRKTAGSAATKTRKVAIKPKTTSSLVKITKKASSLLSSTKKRSTGSEKYEKKTKGGKVFVPKPKNIHDFLIQKAMGMS